MNDKEAIQMADKPTKIISKELDITIFPCDRVFLPHEKWEIEEMPAPELATFLKESREGKRYLGTIGLNLYTGYGFRVGTLCYIESVVSGIVQMVSVYRFMLLKQAEKIFSGPYFNARVKILPEKDVMQEELWVGKKNKIIWQNCLNTIELLRAFNDDIPTDDELSSSSVGELADFLATYISPIAWAARQDILETRDHIKRLDKVAAYLQYFSSDAEFELGGEEDGDAEASEATSQSLLKKQVQAEENKDAVRFKERFKKIRNKIPEELRIEIEREIEKIARLPKHVSDYHTSFNWLDFALDFYSLESTEDNPHLDRVWSILDDDHYGLQKVKQRIYEDLVVRRLNEEKKGPILCFVGPPGVGKTSLGSSVARAMGRKFIRMSLGGLHDEAQIRGHRRTYVGAMYGKILANIKRCGASNPVFMLDEIDKVGKDWKGDPEAALLEVLDPEQNHAFHDNYLDIDADLSSVMFITTANTVQGILPALKDRMEIIELPGYSYQEKLQIAKKFLIPRQKKENGLDSEFLDDFCLNFSDEAIIEVINSYTQESGVRNLEREIGSVLRKLVSELVVSRKMKNRARITSSRIKKFLGRPKHRFERITETPVGTAWGVAVANNGVGELLKIESIMVNEKGCGKVELSGKLERVAKESVIDVVNYFRSRIATKKEQKMKNDIHLKMCNGAISKDGPSAGIVIAIALYSLFQNIPAKFGVAATGEINLSGRVTAIGGVKEKVVAAERSGAKEFILPRQNESSLEDVPKDVRKKLKIYPVDTIDGALDIVFPSRRNKEKKD